MTSVIKLPITDWNATASFELQQQAINALEQGDVLFFPDLAFTFAENEVKFLSPDTVGDSKNVRLLPNKDKVLGSLVAEEDEPLLHAVMSRFAKSSLNLVSELLPHYLPDLTQARTSFRPVEVTGRETSWRKDDTRLHVDAFPSAPVQGRRILRVFSNVNPDGKSRMWRVGETFEQIAGKFMPEISEPVWGSGYLLDLLSITKGRRSDYDHFMLQLHDGMKMDAQYQEKSAQTRYDFPPGTSWMCFTDVVSHAVLSGQHLMEQTFYLPVPSMLNPSHSPLKILERIKGRALA